MGWQPCGPALYASYSSDYAWLETSCDSLDNDCNGFTDDKDLDVDGHVDSACVDYSGALPRDDCDDENVGVNPDMEEICGNALELYKLHNFVYPSTEQGLDALVSRPGGQPEAPNWKPGGYVKSKPKDPWGRDYVYLSPGSRGAFDLYTLGRDGQQGGEGADADIGNWADG